MQKHITLHYSIITLICHYRMVFVTIYFQNFSKHKGLYGEEQHNTKIKNIY